MRTRYYPIDQQRPDYPPHGEYSFFRPFHTAETYKFIIFILKQKMPALILKFCQTMALSCPELP
jgi:hypothetical protein